MADHISELYEKKQGYDQNRDCFEAQTAEESVLCRLPAAVRGARPEKQNLGFS